MGRARPQLPPGDLLFCPTPRCHAVLYAFRSKDGRLLAVCTACKFNVEPATGEVAGG